MNIAAIIPAAGRGSRMLTLTDNCPKCMIPISGRPLIAYLLDQLIDHNVKDVYVIVGYKKEVLIEYINLIYGDKLNITYIEQTELLGLGHATYLAMKEVVKHEYDSVFMMLSDSIFNDSSVFNFGDTSYLTCIPVKDYSRWCMVGLTNNFITKFYDKPVVKPDSNLAIAGVYYFTNVKLLYKSLEDSISSGVTIRGEYQISTAIEKYLENEKIIPNVISIDDYYDFGELDAYYENKKRFNLSRAFNSVSYDNDMITKRSSSNYHKIQKEIMWFLTMPKTFYKYIPPLLDYSMRDDDVYYSMPYCNGSTLQELWMYSNMPVEKWINILSNIYKIFCEFERASASDHLVDTKKFLKNNFEKRSIKIDELFSDNTSFIINGNKLRALSELKDYFCSSLDSLESYSSIIHGDMVFSNIIYDLNTSSISLIDPRGDFNGDVIYGDRNYDLAKLAQCIVGDYDYIVSNLFKLDYNDHQVNYSIYNSRSDEEKYYLVKNICDRFNVKESSVLLLTAIQFLTMIPLHYENELHQKLMYTKFVELLNKSYEVSLEENNA